MSFPEPRALHFSHAYHLVCPPSETAEAANINKFLKRLTVCFVVMFLSFIFYCFWPFRSFGWFVKTWANALVLYTGRHTCTQLSHIRTYIIQLSSLAHELLRCVEDIVIHLSCLRLQVCSQPDDDLGPGWCVFKAGQ